MTESIRRAMLPTYPVGRAGGGRWPAQGDAKDWPMYNRDLAGSRYNPGETAIGRANAGQLVEKWRFPAKGSERADRGRSTPRRRVVDGYVYFGTATDPTFYKLAPDGKLCWSYRNPTRARAERPRRSGRRPTGRARLPVPVVVRGDHDLGPGGRGHRLFRRPRRLVLRPRSRDRRASGGRSNARATDFPGAHAINLFFASPILADGKVIVGGGTLEQLVAGGLFYRGSTGRGFLLALEPKTGRIAWKYDLGPEARAPRPADHDQG